MTKTELANIALGHLGSALIQSVDEVSPSAQHIRRMWDFVRDGLLRQKDWNFALKRATLSRLSEDPLFGWTAAYQLPSDYLRAIEWNGQEAGTGEAQFDIEGERLLCNFETGTTSPRSELRYIAKVENVNEWDASFNEAFSYKLAAAIAPSISTSAGLATDMNRIGEQVMLRAFGPDNLETRPRAVLAQEGSGWLEARQGARNW